MKKNVITARSNPWVQQWLRYHAKPALRKEAQLVWLEGEHLVLEALQQLKQQRFTIIEFILPDNCTGESSAKYLQQYINDNIDNNINDNIGDNILDNTHSIHTIRWVYLSKNLYTSLCSMNSTPSICAVLNMNTQLNFESIDYTATTVVLDCIQDPGNIGTIIRLCAAFGISQVILSKGCASAWSLKALRAGQGAQLAINIYEDTDLSSVYKQFEAHSIPVFVTSLTKQSLPLLQVDIKKTVVWVFGNEGQGVSIISQTAATQSVYIPMNGGFESLNVASAAAICLWTWQNNQAI
jgi:tRNA G18 (ribose-2'-O)-methylase SpoU